MPMVVTKNLISLFWFAILIIINISSARSYPVLNVTGKFCGNNTPECTIPLPHITGADYLKYKNSALHRRIYSVLWGGTYFGWWDFGLWAHKGVDITSKIWTPITAIGSGIVVFAGKKWDRGNVITIKHQIASRTIYSNYAHLQEILVIEGEHVTEWKLIAKMWNTGNSTGPHLHFQIDTNEWKHPYHPGNCGGETLNQNVNEARCRNLVKQNTLDPILFLETNGKIFEAENAQLSEANKKSLILDSTNINIDLDYAVRKINKYFVLTITPTAKNSEWFLAQELKISWSGLTAAPSSISYIKGTRKVFISAKNPGLNMLKISQWNKILKLFRLNALSETSFKKLEEKAKSDPALSEMLRKASY